SDYRWQALADAEGVAQLGRIFTRRERDDADARDTVAWLRSCRARAVPPLTAARARLNALLTAIAGPDGERCWCGKRLDALLPCIHRDWYLPAAEPPLDSLPTPVVLMKYEPVAGKPPWAVLTGAPPQTRADGPRSSLDASTTGPAPSSGECDG